MVLTRGKNTVIRALIFLSLALIALAAVYPNIFMLLNALRTRTAFIGAPLAFPESFYFDNFLALHYRYSLVNLYSNTVLCIVFAVVCSQALSIPAAYAFAKMKFAGRQKLYVAMIACMMFPGITFILPNYLLMSRLGLIDNFIAVIIMWAVSSLPGNVFLLTSLMRGMPHELIEAVKIDGGSYPQLMMRVVVPISLPGITTVTIFNLTGWWNDLLTPLLYLQSDAKKTVTVAVATILGRFSSDYPLLLAGLLLVSLPTVILYMSLQGLIRKGMIIGSFK